MTTGKINQRAHDGYPQQQGYRDTGQPCIRGHSWDNRTVDQLAATTDLSAIHMLRACTAFCPPQLEAPNQEL